MPAVGFSLLHILTLIYSTFQAGNEQEMEDAMTYSQEEKSDY